MATDEVPVAACPVCGQRFERATGVNVAHAPRPGALMVCVTCRVVLIFGADLRPRHLTAAEWGDIEASEATMAGLRQVQAAVGDGSWRQRRTDR